MTTLSHAGLSRVSTRLVPEEDPEFQIAPMIDILLVLLVFFMAISSTEILAPDNGVILPNATHSQGPSQGGMKIINIRWSPTSEAGLIKMDDVSYDRAEQLAAQLKAATEANPKMKVLIRADKNVRYAVIKSALTVASREGAGKVSFAVVDQNVPGGMDGPVK